MKPMPDNHSRRPALGLLFAIALSACASSNETPVGGETNWLRRCETSADCGDPLSCECGLCLETCAADEQACAVGSASCVAAADGLGDACHGNDAPTAEWVCLAECDGDSECAQHGDGFTCRSGLCVRGEDGYDPCIGKTCGEACSPCDPDDSTNCASYVCDPGDTANCAVNDAPWFCNPVGRCEEQFLPSACQYDPCEGKSCGDGCRECPPGDNDCVETEEVKYCQRDGQCGGAPPMCDGPSQCDCPDGNRCCPGETECSPETEPCGGAPYRPCEGKVCGDPCKTCAPDDSDCDETDVEKFCGLDGQCRDGQPPTNCSYDPCEDKVCGELCDWCPPGATDCVVPDEATYCQGDGTCSSVSEPDCDEACAALTCGDLCFKCPANADCNPTVAYCQLDGTCSGMDPLCEDEPFDPCEGKACGEPCDACRPGPGEVCPTIDTVCQPDGTCDVQTDTCEAYDPCESKACGDTCSLCAPGESGCFETADLKYCGPDGTCSGGGEPTCAYEPCGGKSCGETCTICAPNDVGCAETAVIKYCQPGGECNPSSPACDA